jgi:hypothetical protein
MDIWIGEGARVRFSTLKRRAAAKGLPVWVIEILIGKSANLRYA